MCWRPTTRWGRRCTPAKSNYGNYEKWRALSSPKKATYAPDRLRWWFLPRDWRSLRLGVETQRSVSAIESLFCSPWKPALRKNSTPREVYEATHKTHPPGRVQG